MIYEDSFFKFYIEPLDNPNMASLVVHDSCDGFVFRHTFLAKFGNNPVQKVFHGRSGTYEYYKITFKCEDIGQELVLLVMGRHILKPVYLDDKYVDLSNTRLRISTKKGGLTIRRVEK